MLDTEQHLEPGSAQQAWLAAELATSAAPYRIVQMHRPMVSTRAGFIGASLRSSLGPLLARYGVQLVLQGHVHRYERSRELDGTQYIVTGGGGAPTYGYPEPMPADMLVRSARHEYLQLTYDAARMVVRAVDDEGRVMDTTVVKPRTASNAAQPTGSMVVDRPIARVAG